LAQPLDFEEVLAQLLLQRLQRGWQNGLGNHHPSVWQACQTMASYRFSKMIVKGTEIAHNHIAMKEMQHMHLVALSLRQAVPATGAEGETLAGSRSCASALPQHPFHCIDSA